MGVMIALTLTGTIAFAMPPPTAPRSRLRHWVLGIGHGLAHLALGYVGATLWLRLPVSDLTFPLPVLAASVLYLPLVAPLASFIVSAYLLASSVFGVNVNELFAAQSIEDAKSFLRLHFASDGTLTLYAVAVDHISRHWAPNPAGSDDSPWITPQDPLRVRLAEPPIGLH